MARYPLNGNPRISSTHGQRTNMGIFGRHLGIDRVVPVGTPLYAPAAGRIITTGYSASLGNFIEADILGHHWRFAHLSRIDVRSGNFAEGRQLGVTGNTGITTGPHLHYDARKLGTLWNASFNNYVDPDALIAKNIAPPKTYIFLKAYVDKWRFYKLGIAPRKGNEYAFLSPKKFGGLEYEVLGYEDGGKTAIIQTEMFGRGKVFIDGDAEIRRR